MQNTAAITFVQVFTQCAGVRDPMYVNGAPSLA